MMERIGGNGFVIRPTTPDDIDVLVAWHSDPEVYRYWERRPLTAEEVRAECLDARLPDVRCFMIEAPPGTAVGFIQHADLDVRGDVGLDMFLVPAARGKGLGPRVARCLAKHLLETGAVERVTVDPLLSNELAIAAWRKAGFREHSRIASGDHGEPALLMVFQGLTTPESSDDGAQDP